MLIANDFHNFLLMILQTSLAYTQKLPVLLQHIQVLFQRQYTILLESVFLLEWLKLFNKLHRHYHPGKKSPIILLPILFYTLSSSQAIHFHTRLS